MGEINPGNYHVKAMEFAKKSGWCPSEKAAKQGEGQSAPTIKRGSPGFVHWGTYFRSHLAWSPAAFRMLEEGSIKEMTVPAELPEWFDPSFVPGNHRAYVPAGERINNQPRMTMDELLARHGPNFGLKPMDGRARRKPAAAPTDDDLRTHYGVRDKPRVAAE